MTTDVKNFIETNYSLLDNNIYEFFISAYNGLSIIQQGELVDCLNEANIDTIDGRETVLRFIITMKIEDLLHPIYLGVFVDRYLYGVLGFEEADLRQFILENSDEFDADILVDEKLNEYMIYPRI